MLFQLNVNCDNEKLLEKKPCLHSWCHHGSTGVAVWPWGHFAARGFGVRRVGRSPLSAERHTMHSSGGMATIVVLLPGESWNGLSWKAALKPF